jgi:hypothetical protein
VLSVHIKNDTWAKINREWKMDTGPDVEILNKAKGGAFAFFNREAGFGALVTYDPARIDHPYLWWNPERPQVNLELFTPAIELKTGESLAFTYQFEFLKEPPK